MSNLKLMQLQYEAASWKREIGFMSEENLHMKNRLSEILKNNFDNSLLEEVDFFHSQFLQEDTRISSLRNEVIDLEKLLDREIFEDGALVRKVQNKIKRFRNVVKREEERFTRLKRNFNCYLTENINVQP